MDLPPLALYVHLPWCERKCPYCDFNSHEAQQIPESAYVDALLRDLKLEATNERRPVQSIFIGGGTPSLFSVAAIERLLQGIRDQLCLDDAVEITMEANPGSVESTRLAGYAATGVNRFSIGIQSFQDKSLAALGRVHDRREARAAIIAARTSGARSFNLDLMHGLPQQDLAQGLDDLRNAIEADAPHLSWYQLTIEANTRFYSSPPLLPDDDTLGDLEDAGFELLTRAGYRRYEVSAWARPGEECRHNLNYWRFGDYLAIGAGAHGKLTSSDGRVHRYAKTRRPEDYLADEGTRRCAERTLAEQDLCGEFMLYALRLTEGFSPKLFEERTGLPLTTIEKPLHELGDAGLLHLDDERICTTDLGRRFLDDAVSRFFDGS